MIIQIGTEVDESVIKWKYKETDEWKRADIDELIDAFESINEWAELVHRGYNDRYDEIVRCKDCEYYDKGENEVDSWSQCTRAFGTFFNAQDNDFCSWAKMKGGE